MSEIPRELIKEILLYFRTYADEEHRKLDIGPKDTCIYNVMLKLFETKSDERMWGSCTYDQQYKYMNNVFKNTYKQFRFGFKEFKQIHEKYNKLNGYECRINVCLSEYAKYMKLDT